METSKDVEELVEEVRLMARYYYKGFGGTMDMIINDAYSYWKLPRVDISDRVARYLSKIEDFYDRIPFSELESIPEFQSLVEVRKMLPDLRKFVNLHFMVPSKSTFEGISAEAHAIAKSGKPYYENLNQLLKDLISKGDRSVLELQLTDDLGRTWNIWDLLIQHNDS